MPGRRPSHAARLALELGWPTAERRAQTLTDPHPVPEDEARRPPEQAEVQRSVERGGWCAGISVLSKARRCCCAFDRFSATEAPPHRGRVPLSPRLIEQAKCARRIAWSEHGNSTPIGA